MTTKLGCNLQEALSPHTWCIESSKGSTATALAVSHDSVKYDCPFPKMDYISISDGGFDFNWIMGWFKCEGTLSTNSFGRRPIRRSIEH